MEKQTKGVLENLSPPDDNKPNVAQMLYDALEQTGIYPQSIVKEGDPSYGYEQRTEWMEGWNAAVFAITDLAVKIRTGEEVSFWEEEYRDLVTELEKLVGAEGRGFDAETLIHILRIKLQPPTGVRWWNKAWW